MLQRLFSFFSLVFAFRVFRVFFFLDGVFFQKFAESPLSELLTETHHKPEMFTLREGFPVPSHIFFLGFG